MPRIHPVAILACSLLGGTAFADAPPCTPGQGFQPVCGIAPPEDLELTPDGRQLIMSITPGLAGQQVSRLRIMDLQSETARDLPLQIAPQEGWGEAGCAAPPQAPGAHGIHLTKRADGRQQLLVVNHSGREAVEFVELLADGGDWQAYWRGCVEQKEIGRFNDVAATPDGGFVASVMFESASMAPPLPLAQLLDGRDTGYLMRWTPGQALQKLAGSEAPFPNGVQVSADGRHAWFAAWTAGEIRQFDLQEGRPLARVPVGYMVDNLSWGADGRLLGAGIDDAGAFQRCFASHVEHCPVGFKVSAVDTQSGENRELFAAKEGVLAGASVAVEAGGTLYVGSYTGDRLLRLAAPERAGQSR
ncbi:SMP-30/gluconolactonase/LRE family protein [Pseudomonas oryzae]|uniref:SMP-30/Gluconolaconase/LRE-like region-containing protein n=1 Tax=Pseudomonas oryzae TaxID=1392877 RepID=A0A1H1NKT5_9PSED|nr:SMP-30/gluconolactonase/LRE family protein [Pseudomonas oryzae]SDR99602.1 SMP-30/Gluconolaconase/LRE-like region-containing protein [Pseudomonas oryzae]